MIEMNDRINESTEKDGRSAMARLMLKIGPRTVSDWARSELLNGTSMGALCDALTNVMANIAVPVVISVAGDAPSLSMDICLQTHGHLLSMMEPGEGTEVLAENLVDGRVVSGTTDGIVKNGLR